MDCACVLGTTVTFVPYNVVLVIILKERSSSIRYKMAQWSDAETAKLIDIWSEDKIQEELEGCKKN